MYVFTIHMYDLSIQKWFIAIREKGGGVEITRFYPAGSFPAKIIAALST